MGFLVYDGVILAILVLFVWLGWRRGLLLSLCGLAVTIVAFLGAGFLADVLDAPVADAIAPHLETMMEESVSHHYDDLDVESAIDAIGEENPLFRWAADSVKRSVKGKSPDLSEVISMAADFAAQRIAHGAVFVAAFILLYILLTLLLRVLDLVAKLPGLNFCNGLGGGAIGFAKGVIIVFVVTAALMAGSHQPDAETVERTFLLRFFVGINPILSFL